MEQSCGCSIDSLPCTGNHLEQLAGLQAHSKQDGHGGELCLCLCPCPRTSRGSSFGNNAVILACFCPS